MLRNAGQNLAKRARVASPPPRASSYIRSISFFTSAERSRPGPAAPHEPGSTKLEPPRPTTTTTTTNTISEAEIAHFSALAQHWWDPTGEFALLHRMNPARIEFMRDSIMRHEELVEEGFTGRWLQGRDVLDVGCGGGIFAESLARLGANTLAIDASSANILTAQTHASLDPSFDVINSPVRPQVPSAPSGSCPLSSPSRPRHQLEYRHCAAEDLVKESKQFDVVCAMEVIEHVEDPRGFLECLGKLTKPGGLLLLSTISRTPFAGFLTITMAERVLRLVTPGTHTYSKYIKPDELRDYFTEPAHGGQWIDLEQRGCFYDAIKGGWRLLGMGEYGGLGELANYFFVARKAPNATA